MVSAIGIVPQVDSNNGGGTKPPPHNNFGTDPAPVGGLYHMGDAVLNSQYAVPNKYVCEHHNNSVSDPELYSFVAELQKAWNLN